MQNTLAERKLHTIQLLTRLEDEGLLSFIEQLLKAETGEDWANSLTEKERSHILQGLNDLNDGRVEDYEQFKNRMEKKFS